MLGCFVCCCLFAVDRSPLLLYLLSTYVFTYNTQLDPEPLVALATFSLLLFRSFFLCCSPEKSAHLPSFTTTTPTTTIKTISAAASAAAAMLGEAAEKVVEPSSKPKAAVPVERMQPTGGRQAQAQALKAAGRPIPGRGRGRGRGRPRRRRGKSSQVQVSRVKSRGTAAAAPASAVSMLLVWRCGSGADGFVCVHVSGVVCSCGVESSHR